jgi:hypothetical protein
VVTRESELGEFIINQDLAEAGLVGNLVAKSQTVVEDAKHDVDPPRFAFDFCQFDAQFATVVANGLRFAPHLRPGLVDDPRSVIRDTQPLGQGAVAAQGESHPRRADHRGHTAPEAVGGHALANLESQTKLSVR